MVEFWHWWVAAVVLASIEVLAPLTVFMWLGVAAGVVGLIMLVYPDLPWQIQFLVFAVVAIGSVAAFRFLYRQTEHQADSLHLNRRAEQYIGTLHTLETDIVNGRGRATVGDTHWTVEGPDLPKGARVRVVGVDGIVLKVEPAPPPAAPPVADEDRPDAAPEAGRLA